MCLFSILSSINPRLLRSKTERMEIYHHLNLFYLIVLMVGVEEISMYVYSGERGETKLTFILCLLCCMPTDTIHVLLDLVLTTNPLIDEVHRGEMTGQRAPGFNSRAT